VKKPQQTLSILGLIFVFLVNVTVRADEDQWIVCQPRGKGFQVLMPQDPVVRESDRSADDKTPRITSYRALLKSLRDSEVEVKVEEWPERALANRSPDGVLDDAVKSALKTYNARGISNDPLVIGKHPGRDVVFENRRSHFHVHFLVVLDRLYQVMSVFNKSEVNDEVSDKFLDSFKLVKSN